MPSSYTPTYGLLLSLDQIPLAPPYRRMGPRKSYSFSLLPWSRSRVESTRDPLGTPTPQYHGSTNPLSVGRFLRYHPPETSFVSKGMRGQCSNDYGKQRVSTPPKSVQTFQERMVIKCLMLVVRLHEAPPIGDTGQYQLKRGSSQLLVVLGFFHFDLRVDLACPN